MRRRIEAGAVDAVSVSRLGANKMLALSNKWAPILVSQPETGMDYQIASVFLKDGRRFDRVVIVGGQITKIGEDKDIPFKEEDIDRIVVNHGK
jgi:hypothetical protein